MININKGYRISIMLTEVCNLNCSHCYMNANHNGRTLSFEEIDTLINNLPAGCLRISITGGEPYTCKKKLYYMIKKIRNKFSKEETELRIETNGSFFYQSKDSIRKEVQNLIDMNVNTLRLSNDEFHAKGGLNIDKLHNIEDVVKEFNLNIDVSTLVQNNAVAFGRAKKLEKEKLGSKHCLNKKESMAIPYFYTTVDGEVSTCAWKCTPILGNCFTNSWEEIVNNLNTPIQRAIIQSDILEVARILFGKDEKRFNNYKNIIDEQGQCVACREMFSEKYEN